LPKIGWPALNADQLDSGVNFDSQMAAAMTGHLGAHHALLFTPNAGSLAGRTSCWSIWTATCADLVIHLTDTTGTLTIADFL